MPRILRFDVPPGKVVKRGNDHFWSVILDLDQGDVPWSIADIGQRSDAVDRGTIRGFVKRLVAGGYAEARGAPLGMPVYRLLRRQLATPCLRRDGSAGLQGRGQTAMWNFMRGPMGRGGFTYQDLALYASTETVRVKGVSAKSFIKHLNRAGYLLCLREGRPRVPAQWRLKPTMSGPQPPLILRGDIVFDQNKGEAVGPVVAIEVEP